MTVIKDWTVQAQWDDSKIKDGLRKLDKAFAKVDGKSKSSSANKSKKPRGQTPLREALLLTRVHTKLNNTIARAKKNSIVTTKYENMLKSRNVDNINKAEADLSKIVAVRLRKEAKAKQKIAKDTSKADHRRAEAQKNFMANLRKQYRELGRQARALQGVRGSEGALGGIRQQRRGLAQLRGEGTAAGFGLAGMGDLNRSLRNLQDKARLSGKSVTALTNKLSLQQKVTRGLKQSVGNLATSWVSAFAVISAAVGTYRIGEELEQIQSSLLAVSGSPKQAAKDWQYIQDQSMRLGTNLTVMSKGFQQIGTAGKAMGFSTAEIENIFLGAAEGAKAFNLTTEDSAGVMRAFTQIMSYRLAPL